MWCIDGCIIRITSYGYSVITIFLQYCVRILNFVKVHSNLKISVIRFLFHIDHTFWSYMWAHVLFSKVVSIWNQIFPILFFYNYYIKICIYLQNSFEISTLNWKILWANENSIWNPLLKGTFSHVFLCYMRCSLNTQKLVPYVETSYIYFPVSYSTVIHLFEES